MCSWGAPSPLYIGGGAWRSAPPSPRAQPRGRSWTPSPIPSLSINRWTFHLSQATWALRDLCAWPNKARAPPLSPCQSLGRGGPTYGLSDPSGSFPVQYRKNCTFFRNPKYDFPYINLYLSTILRLLVTSEISSGTPNNIRLPIIKYPNTTLASTNVKRGTLRVRESCSHDRDTSPVNNQ